ncbi:hypothetical protein DFP73DRAFT_554451 [Morchella snyderi]|nr:hypothetical protein DFP73DRAFT_554451 [Morchella snyderi]
MAVRDGKLDVVRQLLAAGADVNELGDGRKMVGWAPLHESVCKKGREQIMELLLEKGAKVDILGLVCTDATLRARALPGAGKGLTPLQLAKRLRNRRAVAMLEAYGARE